MRIAAGVLMILSAFGGLPWIYELVIYDGVFLPLVFIAIFLAGMGGSAALERKYYTLVLVGAICSLLLLPIFGIPALILLLKRKREFEEKEEEKENADAYYKRDDFYYEVPYGHVIAYYSKATELDPNSALAYYNRGLAYREKGEVPKAMSDLEKCIGLSADPELTKAAQQALSKIKNSP